MKVLCPPLCLFLLILFVPFLSFANKSSERFSKASSTEIRSKSLKVFRDLTCDYLVTEKNSFGPVTDFSYAKRMEQCRAQTFTLTEVEQSQSPRQVFDKMYTRLLITVTPESWDRERPENFCDVELKIDLSQVLKVNSAGNIQFSLEKIRYRPDSAQCQGSLNSAEFAETQL